MNIIQKTIQVLGSSLASLALSIGTHSVNSVCVLYVYQPKVPAAMNKYKK